MKILIDASAAYFYHSTGIGAYASELISALRDLPIADHISVFNGKTIHQLKEKSPLIPTTCCDFWEQTMEGKCDIAKGFDLYHNLHNGIGMKRGSKKCLITVHDMIPHIFPQYCGSPYKELFFAETTKAINSANSVITVSNNSKQDILRFTTISENRISVIPEAPKHLCKPLSSKLCLDYLRSRYHLKPPFFLYVGGFNRRKNVAGLILGYASVYRRFSKCCPLVIIGKEGSRRKELEDLVDSENIRPYVHFTGYVSDGELPFFYNSCEAFIYPSFYEGFGLPPLEAAACRRPVITSNNSSLQEIMKEGALYIDPNRPEDIGTQLLFLEKDKELQKLMAEKAYQRSLNFSYKKTAEATAAIYENICR